MKLDLEKISLAQAAALYGLNEHLDRLIEHVAANDSADSFADAVERDIERVISGMETGAKVREDDGEDRLTDEIVLCLRQMGYKAERDADQNGNSDVSVRSKGDEFLWIGEAKIHNGYDYLWEGFLQLTTRYSSGTVGNCRGGMIIYIRNLDARSVITNWAADLGARKFEDGNGVVCTPDSANPLRLTTTHRHKKSGIDYVVRHFGVVLHVGPEDRSARKTAARQSARAAKKSSSSKQSAKRRAA